jgi:hypothetical protein
MFRYKFFFFIILFPAFLFAYNGNDYNSVHLIKGCPVQLKNNNYFSHPEKFSYALIKADNDGTDLLYFFVEKVSPDFSNYILVYVSNNVISGDNYLIAERVDSIRIHITGNVNMRYGSLVIADIFYFPDQDMALFKFPEVVNRKIIHTDINIPINFELGIRDEIILMFANLYNYHLDRAANTTEMIPLPINLHLTTGFRFLKHYKLDLRYGIMMVYEDFYGLEGGIFFQSDIFDSHFYGTIGLDFFSNGGNGHNFSESGGNSKYLCIGTGYQTSRHFCIDVSYYFPLKKTFGYNVDPN